MTRSSASDPRRIVPVGNSRRWLSHFRGAWLSYFRGDLAQFITRADNGPRAELRLLAWNQVQCLTDYPYRTPPRRHSADAKPLPPHGCFISPDAAGWLRAYDPSLMKFVATDFWLEVDRGTEKGQVLWDKLARYYQMQGRHSYWIRYWPRLLILVEREAEARLKAIERRLIALNQHYHCALDVRLARADLLDDGKGRLDPTRKAWRSVGSSEFVWAFDKPTTEPKEEINAITQH